ncbi:hypothetical protein [Nitrosomonas sp. Nm166]|uniref:hypothetical protein n=1 Tax=Nitrosomonas sp. Nm166 TaxID=1881054 RepID=UPI0008E2F63E|nr:hypothetical protein [Nitrosomonas sp. Nm166]SFE07539.1 hypothetical protein SAMN05428977_100641 [Nitrosomonas sp. Nm166]
MSNSRPAGNAAKPAILIAIIFSLLAVNTLFAQSSDINQSYSQPSRLQNQPSQPLPESPPDLNRPPRIIHRVGTAIGNPRNSISIRSTDAGLIRRQPTISGCVNCGIIDFVNKIGQAPGLNAIAGGVVAGTVAREVIHLTPRPHVITHPNTTGRIPIIQGGNMVHADHQYHVGITMSDGSQAIIALPDASNLQQGDRIQLIDGVLVLDRQ